MKIQQVSEVLCKEKRTEQHLETGRVESKCFERSQIGGYAPQTTLPRHDKNREGHLNGDDEGGQERSRRRTRL